MIVRELMIGDFAYVTLDADLAYVAQLINERGVGAVPVVDDELAPIGIVTRSNLSRAHANGATADVGEIPSFLLRGRPKPVFRDDGRILRDVMTAPAIYVPDIAQILEVARIMEDHSIKHVPVVEGQKLVGVVNRAEVLRAIKSKRAAKSNGFATADDFRELVAAHETREEQERVDGRRVAFEAREQRIKELAARRLTDAQWRDMLHQAKASAALGMKEFMLIRFPSQLCADGGRAINAPDPNWPQMLRGEPADIFHRWRSELQPHGFQLAAQIIEFPNGMPGDAALFLVWGG